MNKIETLCLLCSQSLPSAISWEILLTKQFQSTICDQCSARFEYSSTDTALYQYNDAMKDYLHQYKFLQDVALAKVFRQELLARFKHEKRPLYRFQCIPLNKGSVPFAYGGVIKGCYYSFYTTFRKDNGRNTKLQK